MNILNIVIIVFLLGMTYWWSTQGLFSSILHTAAVIIAGALAFALWEVIALDLMMKMSPRYAWPLGLIVPFITFLLVIRLLADRLLVGNVHFSQLINKIGGAVFGFLSGILTAGMLLLSISFLPISPSILGYQPLLVETAGNVSGEPGKSLIFPVDKYTAGFYTMLSSGAFTSGYPMRVYQPQLARQAALYRMTYDPNSAHAASPEHVSVTAMVEAPTPLQAVDDSVIDLLGDKSRVAGHNLLIVDTLWKSLAGMFDGDNTLRVSPTQIRLVITHEDGSTEMIAPIAASKAVGENRQFVPFNDNKTFVWGDGTEVKLAFMFMLKSQDRPRFLLVRHTRLELPGEMGEITLARELAGETELQPPAIEGEGSTADPGMTSSGPSTGQKVLDIQITNAIPQTFSKNVVQGFQYNDNGEGSGIVKANSTARKINSQITKDVIVDSIHTPSHRRTVRVLLDRQTANSVFGAARVAAAQVNAVWLEDATGEKWYPIGYILESGNGDQKIRIDLGAPLQSARELPLAEIQPGDKFYLYFSVGRGITLISYNVGPQKTELNMAIPR